MISQTAEYAMRAVVYLASRHRTSQTTAEISEATEAPVSYLAKLMERLCQAEIVVCQRGLGGGFALTRNPNDLTILDVLVAVDAFQRVENCPLGRPAETSGLCPLHRRIDNVLAAAERAFDQTTIGELLHEPNLVCTLPCVAEPVGHREDS